jgi:hypothetical protein
MKTLLALILSAASAAAATTNITFMWDAPILANTAFKFYEVIGTTRTLLGTSPTNRFTVMNWTIGTPRIFTVTATNLWGEGADAVPYVAPPTPPTSSNLAPVPFTFITPVPGVLELSRDLVDWRQRLRIISASSSSAQIELVQIPYEPLLFGRVKSPYTPPALPAPTKTP